MSFVPGLVALFHPDYRPPAVSDVSCRLNDPTVLRNYEYRGIYANAVTLRMVVYEGEPFVPGGASRPRVDCSTCLPFSTTWTGTGSMTSPSCWRKAPAGAGCFTFSGRRRLPGRSGGQRRNYGLGNRVMIRSMAGRDGAIVVEIVAADPGEPLCCPTRKVRNAYRLRDGKLLLASSEVQETLSLADLKGSHGGSPA